jgi:tetratricopeptide (TPR) repeat protein
VAGAWTSMISWKGRQTSPERPTLCALYKNMQVASVYRFRTGAAICQELTPKAAEPHLWMADSLRLSGKYADARSEYNEYLQLSDFDSKLAGQLNYYVLGFLAGFGKKKRAAQQDIWRDLRSLAYFGICDCERNLANFDSAITSCQKALTYDSKDPYAHYALGLSYMRKAVQTNSIAELDPALRHFQQMLAINPDLGEADFARKNVANIQQAMLKSGH